MNEVKSKFLFDPSSICWVLQTQLARATYRKTPCNNDNVCLKVMAEGVWKVL